MYRDGAGGAVMGGRRISVARRLAIPLTVAFALSFLVATGHFFVLLDCAVSFVYFAISPVVWGSATTSVERLAVHCSSARSERCQ